MNLWGLLLAHAKQIYASSWAFSFLVPRALRQVLHETLLTRALETSPDRVHLKETILPFMAESGCKRVLDVGVARYTAHISTFFAARGIDYWTLDIDPENARLRPASRHVVGDALRMERYFPPRSFDGVLFSGVLGFGIGQADAERAILACAVPLKPGGLFVLGWNQDRVVPDIRSAALHEVLVPVSETIVFDGHMHAFLLWKKRE